MTDANDFIVRLSRTVEKESDEPDMYSEIMYQGHRCRNCTAKAVLSLHYYNKETGHYVPYDQLDAYDRRDLEVFLLCQRCVKKIKNSKDITTYGWTYKQLRARDEKLDAGWHRKVYGDGSG